MTSVVETLNSIFANSNICKLTGEAFYHKVEIKNEIFSARISTRKEVDLQVNTEKRSSVIG